MYFKHHALDWLVMVVVLLLVAVGLVLFSGCADRVCRCECATVPLPATMPMPPSPDSSWGYGVLPNCSVEGNTLVCEGGYQFHLNADGEIILQ